MDFLQKHVGGIFEILTPRNAEKRAQQQSKFVLRVGGFVWDLNRRRTGG
jgi:hypothetical protein